MDAHGSVAYPVQAEYFKKRILTSHTYGFSPECVRSWFFKWGDCENCIPHVLHLFKQLNF